MRAEQDTQNFPANSPSNPSGNWAAEEVGSDSPKPKGLNLGPVVRVVRRNILMIAGVAALATLVGGANSLRAKPSYQGSFRILVEPITSQGRSTDPSAIARGAQNSAENTVDYPTLLEVMQSPELLGKIAKQIQTRYPDVTAESLARDLRGKDLVVQRVGTNLMDAARLIDVTYRGKDPERVKFTLEELSKGFLRYSLEDRRTRIGGGVEFIGDQLPSLQKRVNTLESELQALKQRYNITDPATEGGSLSKLLEDIRTQKLQAQRELAEQETLYGRLQQQLSFSPTEAIAASALSENPRYQELLAELKKVESQLAVKSARFTDRSPVVLALIEQRTKLAQLLSSEAQRNLGAQATVAVNNPQILESPLGSVRQGLIAQFVTANNTRELLRVRNQAILGAEAQVNQRLQQHPVIAREYSTLMQQLEIATKTLNQFQTQRETLRIEAAQKEVPWEVVAAPNLARDSRGNAVPTASKAQQQIPMSLVAGLLLGIAAALMKEKLQNIFYEGADVAGSTKLPLLGNIPQQQSVGAAAGAPTEADKDIFGKAFSTLYTNLRFLSARPPRSLVVNSAEGGDGTTTVAVNLARAAASMGQRVLLIDANLRSPQVHQALNMSTHSRGLSDVLAGEVTVDEAIQPSPMDNYLSVLTAGQVAANSVKLLASTQMQGLMQRVHREFDLVIYDTPNLTEFADANFIAALTDGILMNVGLCKTNRPKVKRVMAELNRFRIPLVGVVANNAGKKQSTAYNKTEWSSSLREQPGDPALLESLNVLKPKQSTHL
jgi:polysaccharide biosynthesis transport protein